VRWEYYPIYSHDNYGAVRYDPASHNILVGGEGGVPWDTGASASWANFGPRFGAAYRLGERTVIRGGYGITIDPDNMRNQRNQYPSIVNQDYSPANSYQFINYAGVAGSDGATKVNLTDGIPTPTFPNISVGTIKPSTTPSPTTYLPTVGTATFPANFDRGYYQSWNLFVQREITSSTMIEAGYVGTHGVHIDMGVNVNGAAANGGNAGRLLAPYLITDLNMYEPFGSMTYNGLQTQIRQRIGNSFFGASYTYSKTINNMNGDNNDATLWRTFPLNVAVDKSVAGFDRTQVLQVYYVWELPFGHGHKLVSEGVGAWILGGWQLSSEISRFSGLPFTIASGASANAPGQTNSAIQIDSTVQILGGHDPNHPYYDGTAFINPAAGTLGTTGRNILRGPGLFNINQSITRTFAFKEDKLKFQLVGEAYNLTNTASYSNPGGSCCWSTTNGVTKYNNFAVVTSTASVPRYLQVGGYIRF